MVEDEEEEEFGVAFEELIGFAATKPIAAARSLLVLFPLLLFLLLMTSVLREIGRGLPFILKKRAQALQRI